MSAQIKDYPGTGCPICHTRQNLNECIGGQYLTVQELIHMVSHWRSLVVETDFGGQDLRQAMTNILAAGFAYYQSFSNWRMAHEQAEMFNFVAEDYTVASVNAYERCSIEEAARLSELSASLASFVAQLAQLESAREPATYEELVLDEADDFEQITAALDTAKQMLATTLEARVRYYEKMTVYASKRKAKVEQAVTVPIAASKGCGCGGKN